MCQSGPRRPVSRNPGRFCGTPRQNIANIGYCRHAHRLPVAAQRHDRAEFRIDWFVTKLSVSGTKCIIIVVMNRDARKGDGLPPYEDTLKLKYAIWLICLLLFVAAVDTIPDPPAINPPSSHSCGISALHVRGSFTPLEKNWYVASSSLRRDHLNWFSFRLALDNRPTGVCTLPLVHHAADSSPPIFS
jgi:hypothetical protein